MLRPGEMIWADFETAEYYEFNFDWNSRLKELVLMSPLLRFRCLVREDTVLYTTS
jgi:hypothetical protein